MFLLAFVIVANELVLTVSTLLLFEFVTNFCETFNFFNSTPTSK